jgi:hypothetical protein
MQQVDEQAQQALTEAEQWLQEARQALQDEDWEGAQQALQQAREPLQVAGQAQPQQQPTAAPDQQQEQQQQQLQQQPQQEGQQQEGQLQDQQQPQQQQATAAPAQQEPAQQQQVQQVEQQTAAVQPARPAAGPLAQMPASDLLGANVVDEQGETIASVDDIVRRPGGPEDELYAVLEVGGFLGIGARQVAVPLNDLEVGADNELIMRGVTQEQLEQMQPYEQDQYQTAVQQ